MIVGSGSGYFFPFAAFLVGLPRCFFGSGAGGINVIERGPVAAGHIAERFLGSFFHNLNHALPSRFDSQLRGWPEKYTPEYSDTMKLYWA